MSEHDPIIDMDDETPPPGFGELAREDRLFMLLALLAAAVTAYLYPELPDQVPIHWNWRGEPDGFAPKAYAVWMTPGITAFTWWTLVNVPQLDTRKQNWRRFQETFRRIRHTILGFFFGMHLVMLAQWSGVELSMNAVVFGGVGFLIAAMGNVMGKIKPNHFVGIRVPWTLDDDEVWRRTHRFAGPLWVAGGFALWAAALLPPSFQLAFVLTVIAIIAISPTVYAYIVYHERH